MGRDAVELVMAFEEEFGVAIPDSAAGKMRSVGDVASFVWQAKRDAGHETADVEEIIERIRAVTADQLGVDRRRSSRGPGSSKTSAQN